MSDGLGLALTGVLLLLNAFFVGAEFALISARRARLEPKVQAGSRIAKVTLGAMENISLMMAGAQLGITVCSLALGSISEPAIAHLLEPPFNAVGVPDGAVHAISFVIALSLVTYLHVVIGEMVPKNLSLAAPERVAMLLAPPLVVIVRVLYPLLWVLNGLANLGLRVIRVKPKNEVTSSFTRDEVAELVAESSGGGLIESHDERLLLGALDFERRIVRSVLLPAETVQTLLPTATYAKAERAAARGYSRFPIADAPSTVGPTPPSGYVHIKDLLQTDPARRDEVIDGDAARPLPKVQVDDTLRSALVVMQRQRSHLAAVFADDDYVGIVALEDVLEELVGEIRDDSRAAR